MRPVFRDRDVLSGGGDLGEKLIEALEKSRFLVVLCSPNSAKSKWVNKEIENFKALKEGNEDRILALIIDGEPNASTNEKFDSSLECFPPALRYPLEPIAGDLRKDGDGKERGFLKILAGITQLKFDTLYRRHERAQQKKRLILGATAVTIIALLSFLTIFALNQKQLAEEQTELAEKQTKLAQQKEQQALASAEAERKAKEKTQIARTAAEDVIHEMLHDIRDKLQEHDLTYILDEVTKLSNHYYTTFSDDKNLSKEFLYQKASSLTTSAETSRQLGKIDQALIQVALANELFTRLINEFPTDEQMQSNAAACNTTKGDILQELGKYDQALECFKKALELSRQIYNKDQSSENARALARVHERIGEVFIELKKHSKASSHFMNSLNLTQPLYDNDQSMEKHKSSRF